MPKVNSKGGKNFKKGKRIDTDTKRELIFKGEDVDAGDTEYAQVIKLLGQGRCDVQCFDGIKRQATIRGKMRKKIWVNLGDIVLVGLRDFQDSKCDVMHKYLNDEVKSLQALGEIPETVINGDIRQKEEDAVQFVDDGDSDEEEKKQNEQKQQDLPKKPLHGLSSSSEDEDEEEEVLQKYVDKSKANKKEEIDIDDI